MDKLTNSSRIADALARLEIFSFRDVIEHLPRAYESFAATAETNLKPHQRVVLIGKLAGPVTFARHGKISLVAFPFTTASHHYFRIVAFNRPYLLHFLQPDTIYTVVGLYNQFKNEINLTTVIRGEMDSSHQLRPVYSLPNDLANHEFIRLVERSFKMITGKIETILPKHLIDKYRFLDQETALRMIHFPKTMEDVYRGLRVLKYQEALLFALKTALIRENNKNSLTERKQTIELKDINAFVRTLPYKMTADQLAAIREIIPDMNRPQLMYRLLQGDVGTGKTLVAAAALFANWDRHDQGVLLVPTDILAQQHFAGLSKLFASFPIKIGLFTGSLKFSERAEMQKSIAQHEYDILVGTHALFSEDVIYASLGLAVIDEQHRFGVNQRQALAGKGAHTDLLLMSATPIPRTLSLTLYGDLDVTTLKSFPGPARKVVTKIVGQRDSAILVAIRDSLSAHRQVFIVAPRIEEENDEFSSAEYLFQYFHEIFADQVVMAHGRMEDEQQQESMERFASGEALIMVATSIIEVGIDIPRAGLMVIYAPNHFGLASLHQLRGRIGRNGEKALCLLAVSDPENDSERLNILEKTDDGFKIAEEDLRLRGPGELAGLKQSGLPSFAYLNLISDKTIIEYARNDARDILANAEKTENQSILAIARRQIEASDFTNV